MLRALDLGIDAFCVDQLPEEARELDKELRSVTKEKNEAVRGQDFEKVSLWDQIGGLVFIHIVLNIWSCHLCYKSLVADLS